MISRLSDYDDGAVLRADLVIIGGGPVGLTIAQRCARSGRKVLVVESGLETQTAEHEELNALENVGEPGSPDQLEKRAQFHGSQSAMWAQDTQPYGVRCRALGGSTHAWAGKSAPFDAIDFERRSWVAKSGWPVGRDEITPYLRQAMKVLNLCPVEPQALFAGGGLHSQYWQFARSRVDRLDIMRFGREFLSDPPEGVDVVLDATVTRIALNGEGTAASWLAIEGLCGKRARIEMGYCVLAAGGIENPRLLLVSNEIHAKGIGNGQDRVGRYLMDHVSTRIAEVSEEDTPALVRKFGFFGVRHNGRAHMFMHGLALVPEVQEDEELLNSAVYFLPRRASDDPWDALKRLLRHRSKETGKDLWSVVRGSGLLAKGVGMKVLTDERTPGIIKDSIVNTAIRLFPNLAANEFVSQGVPHKVTGIEVDAICEQIPNPESRITLSECKDRFGNPLACVNWRIDDTERRTLLKIAHRTRSALADAGLPGLTLAEWAEQGRLQDSAIIDMAHTLGTTRMASCASEGVVDANCKVFGLHNLYVCGGSVFPTSGHANPTLMILAFAIRLADHLNARLAK